jgi:hypothetical protein
MSVATGLSAGIAAGAAPACRGRCGPAHSVSGPVLFARYAFGPNRLGYCGPDAVDELFGEGTLGRDDGALRALAGAFEGAWPYLELIARANRIADPLDRRVVEAYWLGSPLLDAVAPSDLAQSLATRFRARVAPGEWPWLAAKVGDGAAPVHAFHVLDVFPRAGLLRSGVADDVLAVIDSCRIRWGRVLERDGAWLVVDAIPLELRAGLLRLGDARPERVEGWRDGRAFVDGVEPGDVVSIHWSWACDRLDTGSLRRLVAWTRRQLEVANRTL